jgi:hypothetical protein
MEKLSAQMISTEAGMRIEIRELHSANALFSITDTFEWHSKTTDERHQHPRKQPSGRVSTDDGMHIEESAEQNSNEYFPKHESREPLSNAAQESRL